jgi:5-methyltetrahydrofolate--homocysteine methyltransferase
MSETQNKKVIYDPLTELMAYYADKKTEAKVEKKKFSTVEEVLKNRIIDGEKIGLENDLNEALKKYSALEIINTILLDGMKVVGELFGSGQMQLPFVLQSAEVMKTAVKHLEQFMEKSDSTSKGTMVIATVKGDVHDIGKNLVDIILTNNGYKVINLGIKCPVETMLHAAEEHNANAIGMSGLLVKSTVIMKENLEVMNEREISLPVVLGGAALTRRYVENDLRSMYKGHVSYANDAFDGLHFMEKVVSGELSFASKKNISINEDEEDKLTGQEAKIFLSEIELRQQRQTRNFKLETVNSIPIPPFFGSKVVENISLDEVFQYVNEVALIRGQWQVRKGKMSNEDYQKILDEKIYPEYENLKLKTKSEKLLEPKVVYGYFSCYSDGNDLFVHKDSNYELRITNYGFQTSNQKSQTIRFTFPRQKDDRFLCLSDFFASKESGQTDVIAMMLVTMGKRASEYSQKLFEANNYKEYLYFHGLSVECAEALAELWHKKIREELGIAHNDAKEIKRLFSQGYQGSRYSFGYPACPNLEDQAKLFELLQPQRIGVELTEEFQLVPEQSTSAIIVHHSQAKYFNVKQNRSK